jgi:release factor glutamine methyltransferase
MTPRPATERLVERALELVGEEPVRVADVGTGAGPIAVTLALLAPRAEIWATDVCESALELTRHNAERHGLGNRVHLVHGDLLDPVPAPLDLVVANLPYLPEGLRGRRGYEELESEPAQAVFAPGDGLDPYRRLIEGCRERLLPSGRLVIQLHRRVVEASRPELDALANGLEELAARAA